MKFILQLCRVYRLLGIFLGVFTVFVYYFIDSLDIFIVKEVVLQTLQTVGKATESACNSKSGRGQ